VTTAWISSGEYSASRSNAITPVADEVDVRVDQPRQHGRIAVID
jgi:hypothetical protein